VIPIPKGKPFRFPQIARVVVPFKVVAHDGPSADWGVRLGFVILIRERFK
jgi:hypothetical protein